LFSTFLKLNNYTLSPAHENFAVFSLKTATVDTSNGNASETKANESFDNGVFFDIEAKRTASTVSKLFSKRSEHIR
jgi:hypothetical protein